MVAYRLLPFGSVVAGVPAVSRENDDGTSTMIPFDPQDPDYQAYLHWVDQPANDPAPAMTTPPVANPNDFLTRLTPTEVTTLVDFLINAHVLAADRRADVLGVTP